MKKFKYLLTASALLLLLCSCSKDIKNQTLTGTTAVTTEENSIALTTQAGSQLNTQNQTKPENETAPTAEVLQAGSGAAVLGGGKTYTGKKALPLRSFKIEDPENTRGLSEKLNGYGYGVAKDGKANEISVNNQKYFDSKGFNALSLDLKSNDKNS